MKKALLFTILMAASANAVHAQDFTIPPSIDRLADKAIQKVNVTLDSTLLHIASKFLSQSDPDQKAVKALISGLKGVYVRSYEFAGPGAYGESDLESLRRQVQAPAWSKMVNVRTKEGEDVDVFFRMDKDRIAGLVVIAAQPKALTIVNIVGPIDLDQLASLSGQFGIPKLNVDGPRK